MNPPSLSLAALLEGLESEIQAADGRTVRLCRDPSGNFRVVDSAERVVALSEFAAECRSAARQFYARERAQMLRRVTAKTREALAHVAKSIRQMAANTARA